MNIKDNFYKILASLALAIAIVACGTTPSSTDPLQQAVQTTQTAGVALEAVITAADAALQAGKLKPADARKAYNSFVATRNGLAASLATLKQAQADAASAPR